LWEVIDLGSSRYLDFTKHKQVILIGAYKDYGLLYGINVFSDGTNGFAYIALNATPYTLPLVEEGWKLINFQIGYNDLCRYCDEKYKQYATPAVFEQNIENAILRVKKSIPRSILNISKLELCSFFFLLSVK
jgi:hypothetical protein